MKVLVAAALWAGLGLGAVALADPPAPASSKAPHFHFKPPTGWVDKTPGGGSSVYTIAVDEPHSLVFQAKVQPGGAPANEAMLDKYAADARTSVTKRLPEATFQVLDKSLVAIGGVTAARFVFEMVPPADSPTKSVKQLQFYIPDGNEHGIMTFTAPVESFDQYAPLFEKTARATTITK
jgi:hypothetical protein